MLNWALRSELPLIAVTYKDEVNLEAVLEAVAGSHIKEASLISSRSTRGLVMPANEALGYLIYTEAAAGVDWADMYASLCSSGRSLIVFNMDPPHHLMFDAGAMEVPRKMLLEFVRSRVPDIDGGAAVITDCLKGLDFRRAIEVSKLAMTKYGEFTPWSVRSARRECLKDTSGLHQVETHYPAYVPPKVVSRWIRDHGRFLSEETAPDLLLPRGIIFHGPPGTGKTMASKHIAKTLKMPLYLLDVGGMLSKYHGESDHNLRAALDRADEAAPCVLLLDEVDKLFKSDEDSDVTTRLLSHLLWWLQEHKSRVLTIMTTNKIDEVPPEMWRPGRVDTEIELGLMFKDDAQPIIEALVTQFIPLLKYGSKPDLALIWSFLPTLGGPWRGTPAQVAAAVISAAKVRYADKHFDKVAK